MKLSKEDLAKLKVGNRVHVYYAKDNDPRKVRTDTDHVVRSKNGDEFVTEEIDGDVEQWEWDLKHYDEPSEGINTSRGMAYFSRPKNLATRRKS